MMLDNYKKMLKDPKVLLAVAGLYVFFISDPEY